MEIPFSEEQCANIMQVVRNEKVVNKLKCKDKGYIKFPTRKKNGSLRWIHAPHYIVKNAQKDVLLNIPTPSVYHFGHEVINGFVPGRSILDNARPHVGKTVVLSIDLKNFFPSFVRAQIVTSLAKVHDYILDYNSKHSPTNRADSSGVFNLITTPKGRLPQGASTSPMVSNWCAVPGDEAVSEFCKNHGLDYTRYADDLTFSTMADYIDEFVVQDLIEIINESFGPAIRIAPRKVKFMRKHRQQRVTGIVVNEKLSIPRARRRKLRAFMHDAEKNGLTAALSREGRSVQNLFGEFSFLNLAHKTEAEAYIQQFKELL